MSSASILTQSMRPIGHQGVQKVLTKRYRPVRKIEQLIEQQQKVKSMENLYDGFHSNVRATSEFHISQRHNVHLESRTVEDSRLKIRIPLSTDVSCRLKYSDDKGNVRIGRLLEDMDIAAPCSCYMHNRNDSDMWFDQAGTLPRTIVTAKLHQADFTNATLSVNEDIDMDASVTWTSESTIEATVTVNQSNEEKLKARFIMVSLNAHDFRERMAVHQLLPTISEEREQLLMRSMANASIKNEHSRDAIILPVSKTGSMRASSTLVEQTTIVYPEFQNPYGTAFGGYLLRMGMETAESCASCFDSSTVQLISMNEATFLRVVPLGSVLRYRAFVANTRQDKIYVFVQAEVLDSRDQKFYPCDRFAFTFRSQNTELPSIAPTNEKEYLAQKKAALWS